MTRSKIRNPNAYFIMGTASGKSLMDARFLSVALSISGIVFASSCALGQNNGLECSDKDAKSPDNTFLVLPNEGASTITVKMPGTTQWVELQARFSSTEIRFVYNQDAGDFSLPIDYSIDRKTLAFSGSNPDLGQLGAAAPAGNCKVSRVSIPSNKI